MFQTNQLVVIGGFSCAGKSTLIDGILLGDRPEFCELLSINPSESWVVIQGNAIHRQSRAMIERVIIHYDIYGRYSQKYGFHGLPELFDKSDSVTIVTLCASPWELIRRYTIRLNRSSFSRLYRNKSLRNVIQYQYRLWKKRAVYRDVDRIFALYDGWFRFIDETRVKMHWIIDSNKSDITMAYPYELHAARMFIGDEKKGIGTNRNRKIICNEPDLI